MKLSSIALVLAFAVNDAQAACTIPAQGTGAAITAATCVETATTSVANDKTNCDGVTLLDTTAACSAIKVVAGASCAETAGTPVTADTAACAAITGAALGTSTACLSVDLSVTPGTKACTYTAGSSAACTYTAGKTAAKTVAATTGGCTVGGSLAAGASCDLQMAATYAGAGTTTYTCPVGTCTEKVTALGVAGATVTADAAACAAVTALDDATMCDLVQINAAGATAACEWNAPTQFTARPTLAATGCAAGAYQNAGTAAASYTCAACVNGKSYAAAVFGTAITATPCTANCPANFYQANNKLATCTEKVVAGTCAAKAGVTVTSASGGTAAQKTFKVSASDIAKVKKGMKAASTGITTANTIDTFDVASLTITLTANIDTTLVATSEVVTLTIPDDTTACGSVAASKTSTLCDAVVTAVSTCAATVAVTADTNACAEVSGGTKATCVAVRTAASGTANTGVSACTYTAPSGAACTYTAATTVPADVTLCGAVTQALNTAAATTCAAVKTTAAAGVAACAHAVAPTGAASLTCVACVTGKTLAASTAILDSAQTAADCVGATTTTTTSSAVSATASVATAVTAALAAAAVLV